MAYLKMTYGNGYAFASPLNPDPFRTIFIIHPEDPPPGFFILQEVKNSMYIDKKAEPSKTEIDIREELSRARKELFEEEQEAITNPKQAQKELEQARLLAFPHDIIAMAKILLRCRSLIVKKIAEDFIANIEESVRSGWAPEPVSQDPSVKIWESGGIVMVSQIYDCMFSLKPESFNCKVWSETFAEAGYNIARVRYQDIKN